MGIDQNELANQKWSPAGHLRMPSGRLTARLVRDNPTPNWGASTVYKTWRGWYHKRARLNRAGGRDAPKSIPAIGRSHAKAYTARRQRERS